jgi:superoxide dismutase, Cu-Zn family
MMRIAAVAFSVLSVTTAIGACNSDTSGAGTPAGGPAAIATTAPAVVTRVTRGEFSSTPSGGGGYTYDTELVPEGATAELTLKTEEDRTNVRLSVTGMTPNHGYGAHLHTKPCGEDPEAAGPHYQNKPDPAAKDAPSTDPAYANSTNEVWLDFTADSLGDATTSVQVPWVATAKRRPNSLVIHAEQTMTEPGKAGTAGARVACLTIAY